METSNPTAPDAAAEKAPAARGEILKGQRWTTLGDAEGSLPCCVGDRRYELRPQTLALSVERGRRVPRSAERFPYAAMAHQLAVVLRSLQGEDVGGAGHEAVVARIRSLPYSSVLSMLFTSWAARRRADDVTLSDVQCDHCGRVSDLRLHVRAMLVREWEDCGKALPAMEYTLAEPLRWGERSVSVVTLEPVPYDAVCGLSAVEAGDTGARLLRLLQRGIVAVDGVRVTLPDDALAGLSADDAEAMDEALDVLGGGPTLTAEVTCPACRRLLYAVLPVGTVDFFGSRREENRGRRRLLTR